MRLSEGQVGRGPEEVISVPLSAVDRGGEQSGGTLSLTAPSPALPSSPWELDCIPTLGSD